MNPSVMFFKKDQIEALLQEAKGHRNFDILRSALGEESSLELSVSLVEETLVESVSPTLFAFSSVIYFLIVYVSFLFKRISAEEANMLIEKQKGHAALIEQLSQEILNLKNE